MVEWPVKISKHFSREDGEATPPGEFVSATRTQKDGKLHSHIIVCPKCGMLGDCPVSTRENPANSEGASLRRVWSAIEKEGKLTMSPSILCNCGCHTFVTDGVMKEV